MYVMFFFFFKQKTAYEMRISDWSSDVCSSDLMLVHALLAVNKTAANAHHAAKRDFGKRAIFALIPQYEGEVKITAANANFDDFLGAARRVNEQLEIGRATCRERVCPYV